MRIGILSMQRVINYGSFLQAYALKSILTDMGHACFFMDIRPGKKIVKDEETKKRTILKKLDRYFIKRIRHYFFAKKRRARFLNDFFLKLDLGPQMNYDSGYDAVIIGSDEVFNCTQRAPWGFAKTLLGEGIDSGTVFSYAASCGSTTTQRLHQLDIYDEVKEAISHIKPISVRDENTKLFVEELTGAPAAQHLDPVLVYDFGQSIPKSVSEKNYILVYAYDGRISDPQIIKAAKRFAKKENKKILCAGFFQNWCDKQVLCDPFELMAYFKFADYVITDTFHGTVLSIKFRKQFCTLIRESNSNKITDLLKKMDLTSREMEYCAGLDRLLKTKINYSDCNDYIMQKREDALTYIKSNLAAQRMDG